MQTLRREAEFYANGGDYQPGPLQRDHDFRELRIGSRVGVYIDDEHVDAPAGSLRVVIGLDDREDRWRVRPENAGYMEEWLALARELVVLPDTDRT